MEEFVSLSPYCKKHKKGGGGTFPHREDIAILPDRGLFPSPHPGSTPSPECLGPNPLSWVPKKRVVDKFLFVVVVVVTKIWLLRVTNK